MAAEENKAIYRRFIEEMWNNADFSGLDELCAPDFVSHDAPPGVPRTREGLEPWIRGFLAGFPDHHFTIEDILATEDRVVGRWTGRGTNTGAFMGRPPTGKPITWTGIDILRIVDGKIVELWDVEDLLGLARQVAPEPAPAG